MCPEGAARQCSLASVGGLLMRVRAAPRGGSRELSPGSPTARAALLVAAAPLSLSVPSFSCCVMTGRPQSLSVVWRGPSSRAAWLRPEGCPTAR